MQCYLLPSKGGHGKGCRWCKHVFLKQHRMRCVQDHHVACKMPLGVRRWPCSQVVDRSWHGIKFSESFFSAVQHPPLLPIDVEYSPFEPRNVAGACGQQHIPFRRFCLTHIRTIPFAINFSKKKSIRKFLWYSPSAPENTV